MTDMESFCRKSVGHYSDTLTNGILASGDERCVRWFGFRVRDYVKETEGRSYPSDTTVYRRARNLLDRKVRDGELVEWRPGNGGYTFYWPVGLAEKLRAE